MKKFIVLLTCVLLCLSAFNSKAATFEYRPTSELVKMARLAAEKNLPVQNEYSSILTLTCYVIYYNAYQKRLEELDRLAYNGGENSNTNDKPMVLKEASYDIGFMLC